MLMEGMDPKELLAYQKKQLKKRLGLEDFMDVNDMINDDDLVSAAEERQRKKYALLFSSAYVPVDLKKRKGKHKRCALWYRITLLE